MTQSRSPPSSSGRTLRPMNSYICFSASERGREVRRGITDPKQHGKATGRAWRALRPEEKRIYEEMAETKKREHSILYPNYKYRPRKKNMTKSSKARQEAPQVIAEPDVAGPSTSTTTPTTTKLADSAMEAPQTAASSEPSSVFPGLPTIEIDAPFINPLSPPFPALFLIDFPVNFPTNEGFDDPFSA